MMNLQDSEAGPALIGTAKEAFEVVINQKCGASIQHRLDMFVPPSSPASFGKIFHSYIVYTCLRFIDLFLIVYTCRRLIDLFLIVYTCLRLIDLFLIVNTCRRLIDLFLITGFECRKAARTICGEWETKFHKATDGKCSDSQYITPGSCTGTACAAATGLIEVAISIQIDELCISNDGFCI